MMKKKLWIPLVTAVCFMYGCSSASTVSTAPSAETSAAAGENEPEETTSPETAKEADQSTADPKADAASPGTESAESKEAKETDKSGTDEDESQEGGTSEDPSGESMGEIEEEHIEAVKNAYPENFPQCMYGKAFEEFFRSPEWKYFESTDGRDVVEFGGECMYAGAQTKVRLQLVVNMEDSTVTPAAMYYNGTPQPMNVITSSLENIFKQYADNHGIRYTATQPLALEPTSAAETAADSPVNADAASTTGTQANSSAGLMVEQGGGEAALSFAAWNNPGKAAWYSPSAGYYLIPFIDGAGNASLAFTTSLAGETPGSSYVSEYYTDAVSAAANEAGGLTYQGYLYRAGETPQMIGMIEAVWASDISASGLTVKMINGNQAMDTSVAGSDYTYSGTAE